MRKLSHKRTRELIGKMEQSAICGKPELWDNWTNSQGDKTAWVEFPLGELMNKNIRGFVWAWKMSRCIETRAIEKSDRFNAQGLEGKVRVKTTLTTALLVYRELPSYRCRVLM